MAKALLTGSFDPITRGHFALLVNAARVFDEVTVCVFVNPDKVYTFSVEQRVAFIREGVKELSLTNVKVDYSDGYVADYAKAHGIDCIVRGVRNSDDAAYELEMARYNCERVPGLETWMWASSLGDSEISSTAVRKSLEKGVVPIDMLLSSTAYMVCDILKKS